MTLADAKATFASLMQKARTGSLTEHDKRELMTARQMLRRAKRPAMNPRQSKYVVGDTVYINRSQVAPTLAKDLFWRVFIDPAVIRQVSKDKSRVEVEFPFGKKYWFDVEAVEFKNPTRKNPTRSESFSLYVTASTGQSTFKGQFNTLPKAKKAALTFARSASYPLVEIVGKDGHVVWSSRGRLAARANPSKGSLQCLGRAVEVRYHRSIGSQPGYYKHEIESRKAGVYTIPAGWVYVSGKSILITEKKPRV
jgi:hypothetical protein